MTTDPRWPFDPRRRGLGAWLAGAAFLPRGIGTFLGTRGVRLLGILPVLIAAGVVLALLAALAALVDEAAAALTPFADDWSESARTAVRAVVGLALVTGSVMFLVVAFATLTALIGQPFYERVSERVERRFGEVPAAPQAPWWRRLPRASAESIALLLLLALCTTPLLLLGFVPVLGQTVVPVVAALVSGFFLAIELFAIPLERRGLRLRARLAFIWRHRRFTVAFGVATFGLFLVPLMNILAMPGAIVGATLLARELTQPSWPLEALPPGGGAGRRPPPPAGHAGGTGRGPERQAPA